MADDASRQADELEALRAFYGDEDVKESMSTESKQQLWRISIGPKVILELEIPSDYPSLSAPKPLIRAPQWVLDEGKNASLLQEMVEMWSEDVEVAVVWSEHCRAELDGEQHEEQPQDQDQGDADYLGIGEGTETSPEEKDGLRTFVPPSTKFHQPMRHFSTAVTDNDTNKREIFHGQPYHPPRSGASESLVAHVSSVTSLDHVNWVLAELLFGDKKVAKASHNMIAYRFFDPERGCIVSDNDDDGEKGSGKKLAALLEMSNTMNAIVVVSRWFGGVKLGPSRFKYIASTAREALDEAGFIGGGRRVDHDVVSGGSAGKRKGGSHKS
jgi:hypothetical protein